MEELLTAKRTRRGDRNATLSEQLRCAIEESGLSIHRIARETAVDVAALSRFVRGQRSLTLTTADHLATYLGLRLISDKPRK